MDKVMTCAVVRLATPEVVQASFTDTADLKLDLHAAFLPTEAPRVGQKYRVLIEEIAPAA
jgi:hypothetical protein